MSSLGSSHAACVKALSLLLNKLFGGVLLVSTQDPIRLDDFSELQPDLALLRWRDDFYRHAHSSPADVLLVIEVADTTVDSDRRIRIPLNAKAGIKETWLVNWPGEKIELYAEPSEGAYQVTRDFKGGEEAPAHTIPSLVFSADTVLG